MRICVNAIGRSSHVLRRAAIAATFASLTVSGCAVGSNAIDNGLETSAISLAEPAPTLAADPFVTRDTNDGAETDRLLDEDTMRLAVTTANLDAKSADGIPWANAATGATGRITDVAQLEVEGQICRQFTATRQAYDGLSLYNGEVCLDRRSGWWTRSLTPVG